MAEFDASQNEYSLIIDRKYYNTLDIDGFSHMMKNPSYCYKFYWLEAIVKLISEGVVDTTFDAVIDEMICNAWYSVREFHIHLSGLQAIDMTRKSRILDSCNRTDSMSDKSRILDSCNRTDSMSDKSRILDNNLQPGFEVRDGLERAIIKLTELSSLPANASKIEIKNAICEYANELKPAKEQLTNMVPYRALAGFFDKTGEAADWGSVRKLTEYIGRISREVVLLPYTLGTSSKLKKEIHFQPEWVEMIQDNTVAILGWIQYEKVKWLQSNNPEVPGLVYKLAPLDEKMRKLGNVRKLWEAVLELGEVRDVFTDMAVAPKQYDVDHFIPWSFVMNDELWNLMPMDSSLNSSKSNKLPEWNPFFDRFAANQYMLYGFIHEKAGVRKLYDKCFRDNLHSIWASQELYRSGNSQEEFYNILQKNMRPVYDSARRQGYEVWSRV